MSTTGPLKASLKHAQWQLERPQYTLILPDRYWVECDYTSRRFHRQKKLQQHTHCITTRIVFLVQVQKWGIASVPEVSSSCWGNLGEEDTGDASDAVAEACSLSTYREISHLATNYESVLSLVWLSTKLASCNEVLSLGTHGGQHHRTLQQKIAQLWSDTVFTLAFAAPHKQGLHIVSKLSMPAQNINSWSDMTLSTWWVRC